MSRSEQIPDGARLLQASGRGGTGNVLFYFPEPPPGLVLKCYRCRRGWMREQLKNVSQRLFEGKRGATARARCETERLSIQRWQEEGFPVVTTVERALPDGISPPATWFAFCPGRTLDTLLADASVPLAYKREVVQQLGRSMAPRHRRALNLRDPLLIQEHAAMTHVFVHERKLSVFDLEHGFAASYPVEAAIAQEVVSYARSLLKFAGPQGDDLLCAWAGSYEDRVLLKRVVAYALEGGGVVGTLRRRWDQKRRQLSKTDAARRLHDMLVGLP